MKATAHSRRASANPKLAIGLRYTGLLSALLLALLPLHAIAKKADRGQIMNYASKTTNAYNAPNTVTTLTGSVKITQGTLLLTGDVAKLYMDADTQMSHMVVTGNPAHIQELDENNNLMTGDGAEIDYDNINGIAVLINNAVVHQQCRGEFHGDKLTYNQNTSLITGESGGDGLVHGVILPKNTTTTPTAAPVICAKPPTAQPVPDGEPVAGKLPPGKPAKPATPPAAPPAKSN